MKISQLRDNIPSFINSFNNSWPYRHLVIDDFLDDDLAEQIFDNFPTSDAMDIHGSDTKKLFGWQINPISPNYSSKQSIDFLFNYLKQIRYIEVHINFVIKKMNVKHYIVM